MENANEKHHLRNASYLVIALTFALRLVLGLLYDLTPQEAYYWDFSRNLALGYFDHPPVTAWTIRFFCELFGTSVFAIRFGAILYGAGALIFLHAITRRIWDERVAFFSIVLAACVPVFNTAGMFFTPDPPLIFFWLAATYFLLHALEKNSWFFWSLAGFSGGVALLSKYTAVFWFAGIFLFLLFSRKNRQVFFTPKPYVALCIALLAFSPQLVWNSQHEWASFAYQSTRRAGEVHRLRLDYFFGYLGAQLFSLSPILYFFAWKNPISALLKTVLKKQDDEAILITWSLALPMMIFFSAVGLVYWVKLNWIIPGYFLTIPAFIEKAGHKLRTGSLILSATITCAIIIISLLPFVPASGELASTHGWEQLAELVQAQLDSLPPSEAGSNFVFGGEYKVPAQLAYRLRGQIRTCGPDILGKNGFQFSYWVDIDTLANRNAVLAIDPRWGFRARHAEALLPQFFDHWEKVAEVPCFRGKSEVTRFHVYRCYGYKPLSAKSLAL